MRNPRRRLPSKAGWMKVRDGDRIYRGRRRNGYSQADLARLVGRTQQYISALENGTELTCSEQTADRICNFLGIELEDAFEYPERTREPKTTSSNHVTSVKPLGPQLGQAGDSRPRGSARPPVRSNSGSAA